MTLVVLHDPNRLPMQKEPSVWLMGMGTSSAVLSLYFETALKIKKFRERIVMTMPCSVGFHYSYRVRTYSTAHP